MVVHLHFAAVLVTCYCNVHVFGGLIGLETLEAGVVLAVFAVFCHVPCQ